MKAFYYAPILAFSLFANAANAESIQVDVPTNIEPVESTLTRAEVIADLHMWRLAGLQELNRGEHSPDTNSYAYRRAYATYVHLRSSTQFAALVQQLQQNPNASVAAARRTERLAASSN